MIDPDDAISGDLIEARTKIAAARKVLQDALDAQEGDVEPLRQAIARLDRIAAEVARVGQRITDQVVGARK